MAESYDQKPDLRFLRTEADRHDFEDWLQGGPYLGTFAVDTETTGLDCWHDHVRVVQFGDVHAGWAIPVEDRTIGRHAVNWAMWYMRGEDDKPRDDVRLVAHRMNFDILHLENSGFDASVVREDSKASSHLLNPATSGLKEAAEARFGPWVGEGERKLKEHMRSKKYTWTTVPLDDYEYLYYAALDPVLAARVHDNNAPTIAAHYAELYALELEVAEVLHDAMRRGMPVDLAYCEEQLDILMEQIIDIEERYDWNLGSVPQCAVRLEEAGHKLPRTAPSKTFPHGQAQVTEEVLEKIVASYPSEELPHDLLQWRRLNRNAVTYFGAYLDHEVDGVIHSYIDTLGARNGRMSSRDPNLQNVPKRRAGDYVRRAFYAPEGFSLISADYKQIEYRIFAAAAREEKMIQAILDGEDLHAVTARIVFNDPSIDEDDPRRDNAKNGNFSEIYMAGISKFARTAGISVQSATDFKKVYHQKFRKVKPFTQEVMKYAQSNGLAVESKFGRRIPVDHDRVYAAVNYLISSTAADVLKQGIQRINRTEWIQYFRLPVHDELIFLVPDELVSRAVVEIPQLMEDRSSFSVPIEADVKVMKRWGTKMEEAA